MTGSQPLKSASTIIRMLGKRAVPGCVVISTEAVPAFSNYVANSCRSPNANGARKALTARLPATRSRRATSTAYTGILSIESQTATVNRPCGFSTRNISLMASWRSLKNMRPNWLTAVLKDWFGKGSDSALPCHHSTVGVSCLATASIPGLGSRPATDPAGPTRMAPFL